MDQIPSTTDSDADFDQFAQTMRQRFPHADFARMLQQANLSTILACLRGTSVERHVGDDIDRFRALLARLAVAPAPKPEPPPKAQPPAPRSGMPPRIAVRRIRSEADDTGRMWTIDFRTDTMNPPTRRRAGNVRNLDVAPIRRASGGWEVH